MKVWKRGAPYGILKTEILDGDRAIATVWTRRLKEGRKFPTAEDGIEPWLEGEENLNLILAAPLLIGVMEHSAQRFETAARTCQGAGMSDTFVQWLGACAEEVRAAVAKARGTEQP